MDMSQANVELVRKLYEAFMRGDIATVVQGAAADVHWEVTGRNKDHPLFGTRRGHAGMQDFFTRLNELQEAVSFTPKEFHAAGDKVFVLGHYAWKFRKSGHAVDSNWCHVFTVRDGTVTRFVEFTDTAQLAEGLR